MCNWFHLLYPIRRKSLLLWKNVTYLIAIRSSMWVWLWLWSWLPNTEVFVAKKLHNSTKWRFFQKIRVNCNILILVEVIYLFEVFLTHAYNTHEFINSSIESRMILLKQYSRFAKRLFQTSTPTDILQRSQYLFSKLLLEQASTRKYSR